MRLAGRPSKRIAGIANRRSEKARRVSSTELSHLRRTIDLACSAVADGERPFAAVLVGYNGKLLGEACNNVVTSGDPLKHAEMNVLRNAHLRHGTGRMRNSAIYVNGEPCTMCAGAIIRYGISRVVFGLPEAELWPYVRSNSLPVSYPSAPVFALARPRIKVISGLLMAYARRPFEMYAAKERR